VIVVGDEDAPEMGALATSVAPPASRVRAATPYRESPALLRFWFLCLIAGISFIVGNAIVASYLWIPRPFGECSP
jgi:hypothetical protein